MSLHHMLRARAGYQAPAPATTDPQFNYVSLLLHGDGTNGAQNNTFVDSSTNNFTITRNGNTTQGSLSPYGNLWSNHFDGNGDYLTIPTNASLVIGTDQFWFEAWINLNAIPTGTGEYIVLGTNESTYFSNALTIRIRANRLRIDQHGYNSWDSSFLTWKTNTWTHIAVGRDSSGTFYYFINGVASGTAASGGANFSGNANAIGWLPFDNNTSAYFNGSLSSVRLIKGSCLYTSSFTPSTVPLTAISGTSLLTCQNNRFIDNSANNFTITRVGDVRVTKDSPFLPTAAYSTSTIGGSGYFDGNGDFLQTPTATALNFNSVDYTAEAWVYLNMSTYTSFDSGGRGIVSDYLVNINNGRWMLAVNPSGKLEATEQNVSGASSVAVTDSQNMPLQQWVHVAICKSGTTLYLFKNGTLVGSATSAVRTTFGGRINVGQFTVDTSYRGYFQGFISNVRLVKGTALYTSSFTPPTAPVTAITNTALLLNFTNAGIFDNAAENDMETVGNAQISTSVKKYGTGSLAFDGTGDWLAPNDALPYTFGSGDFTVEFWLYLNSTQTAILYDGRPVSGVGATPTIYVASNVLYYFTNNANRITGSTLSNTTWTHVALCKSGGSTRLFVNGTQVGSTYADSVTYTNTTGRPLIGASGETVGQFPLNGYIDDLRITKGYARYTANFTPPTAAFPDQ